MSTKSAPSGASVGVPPVASAPSRAEGDPTVTSGVTMPIWLMNHKQAEFPQLTQDLTTDVCIIGAGIAGLSVAYTLAKRGLGVVVVDDGNIASGETGRTSAHLMSNMDDRFTNLEWLHGQKGSQLAAESHMQAIDYIERIVRDEGIDCDFRRLDGYLFEKESKRDNSRNVRIEMEAAMRAGLSGIHLVARAPCPGLDTGEAYCAPRQGKFHPIKYCNGLAAAAVRHGARIFARSRAVNWTGGTDANVTLENNHTVRCKHIVVATNTPEGNRVAVHAKLSIYRTFVIVAEIPRGTYTDALFWDMEDPYHYVRFQAAETENEHDIIIVGGEDHMIAREPEPVERIYGRLEMWARARWPSMGRIISCWSGQIAEPVDALAYIGRNPMDQGNVYIVTGDSGHGLTHATIAGLLIPDIIMGVHNPWETLYEPSRKSLRSLPSMLMHDIEINTHYKDFLMPGDVHDIEDIPRCSGAILRSGMRKVAVYRDENGQTHQFSAACPHLGGQVRWNGAEKSWDCPVHGSRFSCYGEQLIGPAKSGLSPVQHEMPDNANKSSLVSGGAASTGMSSGVATAGGEPSGNAPAVPPRS